MASEKYTALVTGAGGFTGWHMTKFLLDKGCNVIATDLKKPTDPLYESTRFVEVNLTDEGVVNGWEFISLLMECDVVYHIAGLFNYAAPLSQLFKVNVDGTLNLLKAIVKHTYRRCRAVVWGAAGVYGDFKHIKNLPAKETDPPNTDNPYLLSKLYEERLVVDFGREHTLDVTVIRPSAIYGPRSRYGMALSILLIGQGKLPPFILGSGKNRCGLVHVQDIVEAAEYLVFHPKAAGEVFNVTDDSKYVVKEITRHLAQSFGIPFIPWVKMPPALVRWLAKSSREKALKLGAPAPFDEELVKLITVNSWISNEKLKRFGYQLKYPDTLEGLSETISWYKKERWV